MKRKSQSIRKRLIGAKLDGFLLVPDPANRVVKISLPRVLLILTQDSASTTNFDVRVGSFGATAPGGQSILETS